jgi:tetratricopeptide (TPR) repeat protein
MMNNCRFSRTSALILAGLCLAAAASAGAQVTAPEQTANPSPLLLKDLTPETRGDLLMIHKSYQAAIDVYSSCPEQTAEIENKIGIAYHHLYAIDKAMMAYERAIQLNPAFADALNNLGAAYFAQQQFKQAERYYRKALRFAPRSATFRKNLGAVYFAEGKFHKGAEEFREAFVDDPNAFGDNTPNSISEPATLNERSNQAYCLAALFAQAGMNAQAIDYLRKAFSSGFTDYKKLMADTDFASLRKTPEFAQLVKDEKRQ